MQTFPHEGENREWRYQIWNAVLQWLDAIAPAITAKWPDAFSDGPRRVVISAAAGFTFERVSPSEFGQGDLVSAVECELDAQGGRVTLGKDWVYHLGLKENDAELELVAGVLHVVSGHSGNPVPREDLKAKILSILGTPDWRWLHAREAVTARSEGRGAAGWAVS